MTPAARITAFMICVLGTGLAGIAQAGPPQDRVVRKAPASQSGVKSTPAKNRTAKAAPVKAAKSPSSSAALPAATVIDATAASAGTAATASSAILATTALKANAEQAVDLSPAGQTVTPTTKAAPFVPGKTDLAAEVVFRALSLLGVNYRFGGSSPAAGLDCSGLVMFVFNEVTGLKLPRRSDDMSRVGGTIDRTELQPGDLVFFNTMRFPFSHVGIFIGNGQFVHAPSTGSTVRVENMNQSYWQTRFNGARRLLAGESMEMTTSSPLNVNSERSPLLRQSDSVSPPATAAPAGKPASRLPEGWSRDGLVIN